MEPSPAAPTTSEPPSTQPPPPMTRSFVLSTAAGSCFVALLAVAFTVVWRRKQRWRRTRPWLAKLRAETASKIEKERGKPVDQKEKDKTPALSTPKDPVKDAAPKARDKEKDKVVAPVAPPEPRNDGGKRAKERRKRGKEPKLAIRQAAPARVGNDAPPLLLTPKPEPATLVERPTYALNLPPSPRLVPLPSSPIINAAPTKPIPPALVLSGPLSPGSTSLSIPTTASEPTATTPLTSTSISPAATSPNFNIGSETTMPRSSKLPAFPPASPLPPSLARKPPPFARRPTPATAAVSLPTQMPHISRKDSLTADRRKEPSRKGTTNDESDSPVNEVEFPTLNPWPLVGKQAETTKRRDVGRKTSDAGRDGRKTSDAGRGRKPSDAKKKAGGVTNPESTQLASLRGALEAARIREEEVAEERRSWAKRERELQTQINQLSHQLQLATMFPGAAMQAYPGYGYGYPSMPPAPGPAPIPPQPLETVSPEQRSRVSTPAPSDSASVPGTPAQPYPPVYLPFPPPFPMFAPPQPHGSPMPIHGSPMPSPMPVHPQSSMPGPSQPPIPLMMSPPYGPMSPPQSHAPPYPWRAGTPNSGIMPTPVPVPSRRPTAFLGGSPRGGSRSRSPYVHPPHRRHGTPSSTPSVGSAGDAGGVDVVSPDMMGLGGVDIAGLGSNIDRGQDPFKLVHSPLTCLKREREPDDDDESSSEASDYEDSDDDSVIFEDGSVSDSVNLSLYGENKEHEPQLVSLPVDIRIGDDPN